jgi:hypothetical protein
VLLLTGGYQCPTPQESKEVCFPKQRGAKLSDHKAAGDEFKTCMEHGGVDGTAMFFALGGKVPME